MVTRREARAYSGKRGQELGIVEEEFTLRSKKAKKSKEDFNDFCGRSLMRLTNEIYAGNE